jgi:hypothetical protein
MKTSWIFSPLGVEIKEIHCNWRIRIYSKILKLLWDFQTNVDTLKGRYGYWGGGAGWTGQPLLLNWSAKECKDVHSLFDTYKSRNKELKEIVQISFKRIHLFS